MSRAASWPCLKPSCTDCSCASRPRGVASTHSSPSRSGAFASVNTDNIALRSAEEAMSAAGVLPSTSACLRAATWLRSMSCSHSVWPSATMSCSKGLVYWKRKRSGRENSKVPLEVLLRATGSPWRGGEVTVWVKVVLPLWVLRRNCSSACRPSAQAVETARVRPRKVSLSKGRMGVRAVGRSRGSVPSPPVAFAEINGGAQSSLPPRAATRMSRWPLLVSALTRPAFSMSSSSRAERL